jgi:hypothetical protein
VKVFLVILSLIISVLTFSQGNSATKSRAEKKQERKSKIETMIRQQEEGALIYDQQVTAGLRINTDGWGMFYEKGIFKNINLTNLFSIEIGEKKHPKEKKLNSTFQNGGLIQFGNPYVFGKSNIFYQLKPTVGQQRVIGGKTNKNGVVVQWLYAGGLSLGMERPYYLRIPDNSLEGFKLVQVKNEEALNEINNETQGTGLRYGWNQLKIIPGMHAKTAIRFDYGRFNEVVTALEVGVNLEAYSRKINIMLLTDNRQIFFNSYISFLFGMRK